MKEVRPVQPVLEIIPVDRNLPAPVKTERTDPKPIRKRRNRAILGWAIASGLLFAIVLIQWGIIYILQAGPI